MLLLHSSASSARQWDSLAAQLEPAFRVRAVEFHGHGAQVPWSGATSTLADDAELVLAELRVAGTAHVVGHSYGGAVALKVAATTPWRVRSLVVYEPVVLKLLLDFDPASEAARGMQNIGAVVKHFVENGDVVAAAQRFVDFWSGPGSWNAMSERSRQSIAPRMATVAGHFAALLDEGPDLVPIRGNPIPALFFTGSETASVTREIGDLLRYVLPDAMHETLPGAGHMGPLTHASGFNSCVGAFLDVQTALSVPVDRSRALRLSTDSLLRA